MRAWVVVALLMGAANEAGAYCSEPSFHETAPDAPGTYNRPDVPYCLQEFAWSGSHTCESWEIDSYQNDVETYIDSLNDYIRDAAQFADAATQSAQDVGAYARCEADEVLSQHE